MVPLFSQMMKYLHDNGFKVLTLDQLGYNAAKNVFYIKNALPASNNENKPVQAASGPGQSL
jgi:hypothetical protein